MQSPSEQDSPLFSQDNNYTPVRAKLEFDLPMGDNELKLALYGKDALFVLHTLSADIRQKLKHGDLDDKEFETLEWVQEQIFELMDDYDISFDMVY